MHCVSEAYQSFKKYGEVPYDISSFPWRMKHYKLQIITIFYSSREVH
jgi:hypothetical protein